MITKIVFSLTIVFIVNCRLFSQSNWFWNNPLPQGDNLKSVYFVNENTGYSCGQGFTVLKTTNGGNNWNFSNSNFDSIPNGFSVSGDLTVFFLNAETGFIGSNCIFKTTDGGNHWIYQSLPIKINSIFFTSLNTGYVVGTYYVYKTTNSGNNWFTLNTGISNYFTDYTSVYFPSRDTGYIGASRKIILKTTNEGNSWTSQFPEEIGSINEIFFLDNNTGIAVGEPATLLKTTNGGNNWNYISHQFNKPKRVCFTSTDRGYLLNSGKIFMTTNAGLNWDSTDIGAYATDLFFPNEILGYTVCEGGFLLKTQNGGNNWNYQPFLLTTSSLIDVDFINQDIGFIVGENNTILKTSNAGINWSSIIISYKDNFNYVKFFDENTGYISGTKIVKTTNAGLSWDSLVMFDSLAKIDFLNKDTGLFIKNGSLYKTFDGGYSWSSHFIDQHLTGYCFNKSADTGFSILYYPPNTIYDPFYSDLYKTTNGGINWIFKRRFDAAHVMSDVKFTTSSEGFVSGSGYIWKTTDGGNNWFTVFYNYGVNLFVYSPNILYLLTSYYEVYKSTNGGNDWNKICTGSSPLTSIYFSQTNTGYIVGSMGKILKTTNGGGIMVDIGSQSEILNYEFLLNQNYPNPFNPSTVISYSLKEKSLVTLKIYDVLGKKIAMLVNEEQNSGNYNYQFSAFNYQLPSGVYFYRLEAGKYVETKQMILLK